MTHFRLDVTITSITSITSGFCTDVTLDVHFQGAALAQLRLRRDSCLQTKTAKTTTTMVMAKAATRRGGLVSGGSGYLRAGVAEE